MDAKITGPKFEEKQDICKVLKGLPQERIHCKGKMVIFQRRNLTGATLTKGTRLTSLVGRFINSICPGHHAVESDSTSPLGHSCQKCISF